MFKLLNSCRSLAGVDSSSQLPALRGADITTVAKGFDIVGPGLRVSCIDSVIQEGLLKSVLISQFVWRAKRGIPDAELIAVLGIPFGAEILGALFGVPAAVVVYAIPEGCSTALHRALFGIDD